MISEFFRKAYVARLVLLGAVVGAFGVALSTGWIKSWHIGTLVIVVAALLVLLGAATMVFRWLDRARSSRASQFLQQGLSKFMRSSRAAMSPEEAADHQELAQKLEDGLRKLRDGAESLETVPFVVIIGEPGGGKTQLIKQSGITFQEGMNNELAGTGGTRGMDWWFAPHHILIDTAGKATVSEADRGSAAASQLPADNPLWAQILQFLRETRPRCPINSIVVAIPMRSLLLDDDAERKRKAQHLSRSLALLQDNTGVRCPVTVVVTMSDLLPGYREFVGHHRKQNSHTQMLGWSNPQKIDQDDPAFDPKSIEIHCAEVAKLLADRRLAILDAPTDDAIDRRRVDAMDGLYTLPHGLRTIAPRIREYLSIIFAVQQSSYLKTRRPPFMRGLYFASSCQDGGTIDTEVARVLGANPAALEREDARRAMPTLAARSNGIQDLFNEKIFKETNLVTAAPHVRAMIRRRNAALIGGVGVAAVSVGVLGTRLFSDSATEVEAQVSRVTNLYNAVGAAFVARQTAPSEKKGSQPPASPGRDVFRRPDREWVVDPGFEAAAEKFVAFLPTPETPPVPTTGPAPKSEPRAQGFGASEPWVLRMMQRLGGWFGIHSRAVETGKAWNNALDAFIVQPTLAAAAEKIRTDAPSARKTNDGLHTFGLVLDVVRLKGLAPNPLGSIAAGGTSSQWVVPTTFDLEQKGPDLGAVRRHLRGESDESKVPATLGATGSPLPPVDRLSQVLAQSQATEALVSVAKTGEADATSAYKGIIAAVPKLRASIPHFNISDALDTIIGTLVDINVGECVDATRRTQLAGDLKTLCDTIATSSYATVFSASESDFEGWQELLDRAILVESTSASPPPADLTTQSVRDWRSILTNLDSLKKEPNRTTQPEAQPTQRDEVRIRAEWRAWLTSNDKPSKAGFQALADVLASVEADVASGQPKNSPHPGWLADFKAERATSVVAISAQIATTLDVAGSNLRNNLKKSLVACVEADRHQDLVTAAETYVKWLAEVDESKLPTPGAAQLRVREAAKKANDGARPRAMPWMVPVGLKEGDDLDDFDAKWGRAILDDLGSVPAPSNSPNPSDPFNALREALAQYQREFNAVWGKPAEAMSFRSTFRCPELPDSEALRTDLNAKLTQLKRGDPTALGLKDDAKFWIDEKKIATGDKSSTALSELAAHHTTLVQKVGLLLERFTASEPLVSVDVAALEQAVASENGVDKKTLDNLTLAFANDINARLLCTLPKCDEKSAKGLEWRVPHREAKYNATETLTSAEWNSIISRVSPETVLDIALREGVSLCDAEKRVVTKADYEWISQWQLTSVAPGQKGKLGGRGTNVGLSGDMDFVIIEFLDDQSNTPSASMQLDANEFGEGGRATQKCDVAVSKIHKVRVSLTSPSRPGRLAPSGSPSARIPADHQWLESNWAGARILLMAKCQFSNATECEVELPLELFNIADKNWMPERSTIKLKFVRTPK